MKSQAVTTTLAVLLAIALAAIAALVVAGEVGGSSQTIVGSEPVAVEIDTAELTAAIVAADRVTNETDGETATEAADVPTVDGGGAAPSDPAPTNPGDVPADPAPANPPTNNAPQGEAPEDTDPEDAAPQDEAPEDTDPEDAAPEDEAPEDTDPEDADPERSYPSISIFCIHGYTLVDEDCVFTGCPFNTILTGDICKELSVWTPCPDGIRLPGGGCLADLVIGPGAPVVCLPGQHLVDGSCVSVCPDGHMGVGGFCLEQFDLPDLPEVNETLVLPDLELTVGTPASGL